MLMGNFLMSARGSDWDGKIHVKPFKKTEKNQVLLENPKKCPKCLSILRNVSPLMMGPNWKCDLCNKSWMYDLSEIVR